MKKSLIILLFICNNSIFAGALNPPEPTTLEYKGKSITIPPDIRFSFDELENRYFINYKSSDHIPLVMRINIISTGKILPIFDLEYYANDWLFIDYSVIYIKNSDKTVNFRIEWEYPNESTDVSHPYIYERFIALDDDLTKFILNNINIDSEITIRFYGKNNYSDRKLSDIKSLLHTIEIYKQLK